MTPAATYALLAVLPAATAAAPVTIGAPAVHLAAGAKVEISLPIEIAPGLHVQANPASRPELIPLSIRFIDPGGLAVGAPLYPTGSLRRLEAGADPLKLYEGSVQVGIPLEVPAGASPGERVVRGAVRFQACDDRRCHFPTTVPFAISVRVTAPPDRAQVPPHRRGHGGSSGARR